MHITLLNSKSLKEIIPLLFHAYRLFGVLLFLFRETWTLLFLVTMRLSSFPTTGTTQTTRVPGARFRYKTLPAEPFSVTGPLTAWAGFEWKHPFTFIFPFVKALAIIVIFILFP